MQTAVATKTSTKVITHTMIATAIMFLGFATLAASAVGGLQTHRTGIPMPDLQIKKIYFNPTDDIIKTVNGVPITIGQDPATDRVAIDYRNIGVGTPAGPFYIRVVFNPAPYILGTTHQLLPVEPGSPDLVYKEVGKFSPGEYIFAVESKTGDPGNIKNLNRYGLGKDQNGRIEFTVPKYYRQMIGNGTLVITAYIDDDGYEGLISETDETNNDFVSYVHYSEIEKKEGDACKAGEDKDGANWMLELCRDDKALYACVDRYRFTFIGCAATESECLDREGDIQACKTGPDFVDRPNIQKVSLRVANNSTYTTEISKIDPDYTTGTLHYFDKKQLGQSMKIVVSSEQVTSSTSYGFYISEAATPLAGDLRSIEKKILWKTSGIHYFKTWLPTFTVHVFVKNGDKQGALQDEFQFDADDAASATFMEQ